MAFLNDVIKSGVAKGMIIGAGVVLLAPVVAPIVASAAGPAARAAAKTGRILYDKGCEAVAELNEVVEDLVAEAKSDMRHASSVSPSDEGAASTAAAPDRTGPE